MCATRARGGSRSGTDGGGMKHATSEDPVELLVYLRCVGMTSTGTMFPGSGGGSMIGCAIAWTVVRWNALNAFMEG